MSAIDNEGSLGDPSDAGGADEVFLSEEWVLERVARSPGQSNAKAVRPAMAEPKAQAARRAKTEPQRVQVRAANDLDRRWPVGTLLDALDFPPRGRKGLQAIFSEKGMLEATLRDVMDLVIAVPGPSVEDWFSCFPAYGRHHIGHTVFRSLILALSWADCGDALTQEWARRRMRAVEFLGGVSTCRCMVCLLLFG